MANHNNQTPISRQLTRVAPLVLVGSGLIVLSVLAFIFWPGTGSRGDGGGAAEVPNSSLPVEVDFSAPKLTLLDLEGKAVSLDDYRGQVVLVNNWATWCPPCKAEMPELQAYYDSHSQDRFTIIAIDAGDSLWEVRQFVHDFGLTFPVWTDSDMEALSAFRNRGLPSSYVIDEFGTVRLAWTGAVSLETLEKYVTPLLED